MQLARRFVDRVDVGYLHGLYVSPWTIRAYVAYRVFGPLIPGCQRSRETENVKIGYLQRQEKPKYLGSTLGREKGREVRRLSVRYYWNTKRFLEETG